MPTTLTGLLLFVVLLLPGFAYAVGKERNGTGQQLTPFRETAAVVAASISFELIVLAIFAVIRALLPSLTPDIGALIRNGPSYLRGGGGHAGHYGQVAIVGDRDARSLGRPGIPGDVAAGPGCRGQGARVLSASLDRLGVVDDLRDVAGRTRHPHWLRPRRRILCRGLARVVQHRG
jgi:hypothetical protein